MLNYYQNITIKYSQSFTGKERDSETGFSYFGARYYDSDILTGWLSVDPMADKYPGLSPYNYCALNPIRVIDPNGDSCVILLASKAVGKAGHMAILVQGKGEDKNWYLYSKNGEGKNVSGIDMGDENEYGIKYSSIEDFEKNYKKKDYYTHAYVLPTTPEQDEIIAQTMKNELDKEYNLLGSNCCQAVNNSLTAAGVNTNDNPADSFFEQINPFKYLGDNIIPATMYKNMKDANKGYQELNWRKR
jgi:RHS repeat-associated protein